MTAAEELLVLLLVTGTAIASGEMFGDDEAVMIELVLTCGWLMAIETVDAFARVGRHFELVDDGVLEAGVTLGALAGGADEIGGGLLGLNAWARKVNEEGRNDERETDGDSNKDRAERHAAGPPSEIGGNRWFPQVLPRHCTKGDGRCASD
jgi:hypothetical protein